MNKTISDNLIAAMEQCWAECVKVGAAPSVVFVPATRHRTVWRGRVIVWYGLDPQLVALARRCGVGSAQIHPDRATRHG
jgi:hypothetical protein